MTVIGLAGLRIRATGGGVLLPAPVEITLAVALLSFTAMMLGLVVSALVSKEEVTMPLLVLLAIIQVVFCGALLRLHGVPVLDQLSWLVPSRWALAAMASTIDLRHVVPGTLAADPLFAHKAGTWLLDMGALVLMSLVLGLLVARLLRRHEPTIMRG
jgi:ABC-type multidrug transport system permease subunit